MVNNGYHLVMTNIAMENPHYSHGGLVRWENHNKTNSIHMY